MDADEAYDRLHGVDGHTQAATPRYTSWRGIRCRHEGCAEFGICLVGPPLPPALDMARKAEQAERRTEDAEAEVERLRDVVAQVRRAFDLQCPPMSAEKYTDRGAWMAHSWWNTVLGGILNRGEVGTGAGEGATGQDTGIAWVTRSTDCPKAPAQAHLPGPYCEWCGHADGEHETGCRLGLGPDECPGLCGEHHWLDRPESDTRECLICGTEVAG